jgi:hypothetical protein
MAWIYLFGLSGSFDGGELRQAAEPSGRPLNHYDALGITVAGWGKFKIKPGGHAESEQRSAAVFAITGMSPLTSTFIYGG